VRRADPEQAARLWLAALLRGEDDRAVAREAHRAARLTVAEVQAAAARMLAPDRRRVIVIGRAPDASPASR
jgi:predicted Zn-dependent peptidase